MFRDSFEAKIIRVDGFSNECPSCEVLLNNKSIDQFPSLAHTKTIILSGKGIYQFILQSSSVRKSVSFKIAIFKEDGAQWLPLFDENDLIDELPEETSSPRFLMVLCKSRTLHTIEESGEISEESSLSVSESEEALSEIKQIEDFNSNVCNTQEFFESIDSSFMDQSSIKEEGEEITHELAQSQRLNHIWEADNSEFIENHDRNSFDIFKERESINHKAALDALTQKYESLVNLHKIQEMRIIDYDSRFIKFIEGNKEQMKRSQKREESLLELVSEKENEAKLAQDEVHKLRSEIKKLEIERTRLKDNEENLITQINLCDWSLLIQENKVLKDKVTEFEKSAGKVNRGEELEKVLIHKDVIIKELQRQIYHFKPSDGETRDSQESMVIAIDDLDEAVKNNAKAMNLVEPIIRDKEQTYIFGNRKLSLVVNNGNLMCRIGANFKPFKEYMENFVLDTIIPRTVKKKISVENNIDSEYDIQNYKDAQHSLKNASKKFNRTTITRKRTKS